MAKGKFKRMNRIAETEGSKFGDYKEYNGGGSPKGEPWNTAKGRIGWEKRKENGEVKEGEHRVEQPRTDDGKFTYNSVNGKETKYDGRGKTVNPLLTGGENGVKIDEVEKQFEEKEGSLYEKFKGKFFRKGSEKITKVKNKFVTKTSSDSIWNIAKYSFDVTKGRFGGGQKGQSVDEDEAFATSKSGRPSKAELAAKAKAKKTNSEQWVLDDNGDIYNKEDVKKEKEKKKQYKKKAQETPTKEENVQKPAQEAPKQEEVVNKEKEETIVDKKPAPSQSKYGVIGNKYNEEKVNKVFDFLNEQFSKSQPEKLGKLMNKLKELSPEALDKQIDSWIAKGVDFGF